MEFIKNLLKTKDREKFGMRIVLIIAICASIASFLYYYQHDLVLLYGDSKAHLTLSRRVVSSLTPGITQLGGIWLPLPHLLNLLTVWNDFMFYSGISGSIVSMISFILAAYFMYKSIYVYSKNFIGGILGSLIFIFNPTLLYLQATPMTEMLSIMLLLCSIYMLIKWAKTDSLGYLLVAAGITALSTLTRYDNWFLIPSAAVVIFSIEFLKKKAYKTIEGNLLVYLTLGFFGIFLWMLYNFLIFGSPLNFSLGQGSGSWYATAQHSLSKHNAFISIITYLWTSIDVVGLLSILVSFICVSIFVIKHKLKSETIVALLFLAPIIFNILSLFIGQSLIFSKHLEPFYTYNSRYGVNTLPAIAFFIGAMSLKGKMRYGVVVCAGLIFAQYIYLHQNPIIVLEEMHYGKEIVYESATTWLKENPIKGNILLSDSSLPISFDARIPQENVISEASGKYWKTSLVSPQKYVSRIIMSKEFNYDDIVWRKLHSSRNLEQYYTLTFQKDNVTIYDLKAIVEKNKKSDSRNVAFIDNKQTLSQCEYVVTNGDTLWKIAKNKLGKGKDFYKIVELNDTENATFPIIHPKQILSIPCSS